MGEACGARELTAGGGVCYTAMCAKTKARCNGFTVYGGNLYSWEGGGRRRDELIVCSKIYLAYYIIMGG